VDQQLEPEVDCWRRVTRLLLSGQQTLTTQCFNVTGGFTKPALVKFDQ
jgi:hypothetical protein